MQNAKPKILHVDDDLDILEISRMALEAVGELSVTQCSSGFKAVEIAPELQPDLFLLDVMMPEIDGVETLQELRKLPGFSDTPAIFMTAKSSPDDIEMLMRRGAISVIKKPFDPLTLADEIVELWRGAMKDRAAS
jgi:CheY-like chemotaxis protein